MDVVGEAEEARRGPQGEIPRGPARPDSRENARMTEYYRTKVLPLREKCEEALGDLGLREKFEQVHAILRQRWVGECADEGEIKAALEAIVPAESLNAVGLLVDQLIFCEEHEK
jgi:uncharacterized protein YjiS (DUF1127 family)